MLDAGAWHGAVIHAYRAARLPSFEQPEVEVIAAGSVWRITEGVSPSSVEPGPAGQPWYAVPKLSW